MGISDLKRVSAITMTKRTDTVRNKVELVIRGRVQPPSTVNKTPKKPRCPGVGRGEVPCCKQDTSLLTRQESVPTHMASYHLPEKRPMYPLATIDVAGANPVSDGFRRRRCDKGYGRNAGPAPSPMEYDEGGYSRHCRSIER